MAQLPYLGKTDLCDVALKRGFVRIAAIHSRKMLQLPANVRFGEVAMERRELA
jgi:hypothetical protein